MKGTSEENKAVDQDHGHIFTKRGGEINKRESGGLRMRVITWAAKLIDPDEEFQSSFLRFERNHTWQVDDGEETPLRSRSSLSSAKVRDDRATCLIYTNI